MQDKPSLFLSGFLLIASGILVILNLQIRDENLGWLKLILLLAAAVLGFYGLALVITWITWTVIEAKAEAARVMLATSEARFPVVLARALAPLPESTTELIGRSTILEVYGIMDDRLNLSWRVRCIGGDCDWEFIQDYILASKATAPFMYPVNQAYTVGEYINAERQASAFCSSLALSGWADPAAGNRSARLTVPWRQLADKFGLED